MEPSAAPSQRFACTAKASGSAARTDVPSRATTTSSAPDSSSRRRRLRCVLRVWLDTCASYTASQSGPVSSTGAAIRSTSCIGAAAAAAGAAPRPDRIARSAAPSAAAASAAAVVGGASAASSRSAGVASTPPTQRAIATPPERCTTSGSPPTIREPVSAASRSGIPGAARRSAHGAT